MNSGRRAAEWLASLAAISEPGPGVTRLPFTPEHREALDLLTIWMQQTGLEVTLDDAGTLIGRLEGPADSATFYMGSHQDSVREGGGFDGIMGVVLPILALEKLKREGVRLPFSIEVLAFADEEGVRFPTALLGPRALAGTFDPAVLEMTDSSGQSLKAAMQGFGLNPANISNLARPHQNALGYMETHIEQGPVLCTADEALGVVTSICGIERHQVTIIGETGHAGTLPMGSRKDAVVAAASIITEVNRYARATPGLRGTVGALTIAPNVVNAVPREARFTIELRAPDDALHEGAGWDLTDFAQTVATGNDVALTIEKTYAQPAQPCDKDHISWLQAAVKGIGGNGLLLPSGATHDASAMADLCPISMLFVRCRDGLSHNPAEYATPEDLDTAIRAIAAFLKTLPAAG